MYQHSPSETSQTCSRTCSPTQWRLSWRPRWVTAGTIPHPRIPGTAGTEAIPKPSVRVWESRIQIPRDRDGEYEPALIPKGASDVSELEFKVLSLYAKGTSDRDISQVIQELYGFS